MDTTAQTPKHSFKAVYLILFILVLLGILFFVMNKRAPMKAMPEKAADVQIEQIQTQGTSDEVNSIEADLNNTNIDSLDQ